MVLAKTELFSEELQQCAELFKVLGHPARLRILQFLAESNTCISGDISDELPLGRTTVNQHLKELKDAGFILGHIEGIKTWYCLNPEKINELTRLFEGFIKSINKNNYQCNTL